PLSVGAQRGGDRRPARAAARRLPRSEASPRRAQAARWAALRAHVVHCAGRDRLGRDGPYPATAPGDFDRAPGGTVSAHAVLLAGGSGTRFWPLSRARRPKQFLELVTDRSLLTETYARIAPLCPPERLWVVCGRD